MMAVFRHGLDRVLDKFISRKLLVWAVATILMYFAKLESSDWVLISMVYLGSQGVLDIVERIYKIKNTTTTITETKNV